MSLRASIYRLLHSADSHSTILKKVLLVYAALFAVFATAAILAPPSRSSAFLLSSAIVGALVALCVSFVISDGESHSRRMTVLLIGGMAVDLLCNYTALQFAEDNSSGEFIAALLKGLANVGVLSAATGAGLLLARGLREPHYLIMAAVVGAITDIFSVYAGPTKHLVKTSAFPYVSYQWGLIGSGGIFPCVGLGDFIFLALYFAGVRKFGLDQKKTLLAMGAALVIGFLSTLISPRGVPALPFMSFGLLAVNLRALRQKI